jgi:pimeloyl-ACP methyl ester carboxylesterase
MKFPRILRYPPKSVQMVLCICLILLTGCSTPAQRLDEKARAFGFRVQVDESTEFTHRIYRNSLPIDSRADTLNVYLEGDGTPWVGNHRVIAADPTPRTPLMLDLMSLDDRPALYVGRPCYHGYADTPACTPTLWTDARYSERVVDSMAQVVRQRMRREGVDKLVLFGHSGGGVLAVLLANRIPQTSVVVTLAANLDIDAWVDLHGYSPLHGSLNPSAEPVLDPRITQLHLVGEQDRNVPSILQQIYLDRYPDAQTIEVPGYDHVCCWSDLWPKVLDWAARVSSVPAGQRAPRFSNH